MGSVVCYGTTFQYALYNNKKMIALKTQVIPVFLPQGKSLIPIIAVVGCYYLIHPQACWSCVSS